MDILEQRMAELYNELTMLRTALEFLSDASDQARVYTRMSTTVMEYTQLLEVHMSGGIPKRINTTLEVGEDTQ